MADKPVYVDLEGYMLVRADYHERLVACVERAEMKLAQFKDADWPGDIPATTMQDRVRLLGFVLGTADALQEGER